jgi:hypothetical protein
MAAKEIERLSKQANLDEYLVGRSEGFACRCEPPSLDIARKPNPALSILKEARPELLHKTVCGQTISQATLDRLSSSRPTADHSDFTTTEAALKK